jgi:processing peptidase subunit alpha
VELLGANIIANASREQMSYNIDCLRVSLPQALEVLADAVTQPAFLEQEVGGALGCGNG